MDESTRARAPAEIPVRIDRMVLGSTIIKIFSHGSAPHECNVGSATGFFYKTRDTQFLITNRHVVCDEEKEFYPDTLEIRVHTNPDTLLENRPIQISLYDDNREKVWLEHPDIERGIDVVALQIDESLQGNELLHFWSPEQFLPENVILELGERTLVIGYPMAFYDRVHNLPIAKSGTIASTYQAHFLGRPHFLIDANLHSGTSGSPVVLPRGTIRREAGGTGVGNFAPCLLGVNSGYYTPGGINVGLNIVWYAFLLEEIIHEEVI